MKLKHRLTSVLFVAVVMTAWPAWSFAQCANQDLLEVSPWVPAAPFAQLVRLHTADCLGGPQDTSSIAAAVTKAVVLKPGDDPIGDAVGLALELVSAHSRSLNTGVGRAVLGEVAAQADVARTILGSGKRPAISTAWELVDTGRIDAVSLHLGSAVGVACQARTDECRDQFETAREVLRAATLIRRSLAIYDRPVVKAHLKDNARRVQMWDAYFTGARSQYPWELAINGRRMNDTRQEVEGVKLGYRDVPNDQVMLLHPDVAFEYAADEPEGNRFAGLAIVDLVGYNRWKWNADGSMGFAIGASFILTMGDHVNMDDVGYGFMVHVANKWSVGMTFASGQQAVLVSGDVAQLWTKISAVKQKKLKTGQ